MNKMDKIWKSELPKSLKFRYFIPAVETILLCTTWTLSKAEEKSLGSSLDTPVCSARCTTSMVSPKVKAEKFAQLYAAVSKLKLSKADWKETLRFKRLLNSNIVQSDSFPDFTMQELETAIKRMRRKGAPGEDDIPLPSSRSSDLQR